MNRFHTLKTTIVAALVLMAAVPMTMVIIASYHSLIEEARRDAGRVLGTLAADQLDVIYRNHSERVGDVQPFAGNSDVVRMNPEQIESSAIIIPIPTSSMITC